MRLILATLFTLVTSAMTAQFPGPAQTAGTTAIPKDSSIFVAWAANCHIDRGLQDVSTPSLGLATFGDSSMALGIAGSKAVVSLGDGGSAIVTFSAPITNGPGFDFAVFENAFNDTFLELAFVEVSSDGVNYFRFPATSNSPTSPQYGGSAVMDATKLDNLAGKYRALFGTPFDLQQLTGISQLNINAVTHVKIIDVVGSINSSYGTYDKNNNIINDPWPTGFASSGFDLDAVGVINQVVGIKELTDPSLFAIYPNPVSSKFNLELKGLQKKNMSYQLVNSLGTEIKEQSTVNNNVTEVDISNLSPGLYFLYLHSKDKTWVYKLIKE
jgi:hypothetical protein